MITLTVKENPHHTSCYSVRFAGFKRFFTEMDDVIAYIQDTIKDNGCAVDSGALFMYPVSIQDFRVRYYDAEGRKFQVIIEEKQ